MTIINVMVDDQRLEFSSMPVVASEGVKETYVKFALSSDWSGFGATALFYRDDSPEDVYTSVLDGAGLAEVPYEITAAPGWIRFGLSGSDGTSVHTSEILKYKIVKGKYTSGQSSEPPAPGIYEQMLAIAGQMRDTLNASVIEQNAIIQGLVTDMDDLRSDMETEQTTFESVVTGQINTLVNNFAGSSRETILFEGSHAVNIGDEIDLVSDPTVYDYLDIVLNDGMVGTIIGPTQNSQWRVTGETVKSTGTSVTTYVIEGVLDAQSLCLRVSTACAIVDTGTASTRYDLGSGPIADESLRRYCLKVIGRKLTDDAEVLNIRVGADGVTYQTAGTAVRSQLDKKLNAPISSGTVDYGTSGQLLATDGQGNTEWVDSVIPDGSITVAKLAPGVIDTTYQIQGAAASSVTVGQSLASKANVSDVTALDTRVSDLESEFEAKVASRYGEEYSPNLVENAESMTSGYLGLDGNHHDASTMAYTDYIPVKTGWVLRAYFVKSGVLTPKDLRFVTCYDSEKTAIASAGATNVASFTVPSGVAYVRVTYTGVSELVTNYQVSANFVATSYSAYTPISALIDEDFLTIESSDLIEKLKNMTDAYGIALPKTTIRQTVGLAEKWYYASAVTPDSTRCAISAGTQYTSLDDTGITFLNNSAYSSSNGYRYRWYDVFLSLIESGDGDAGYGWARKFTAENLASCSLLCIGDSTVDHDTMTATILSHFAEQGATVTLLGTLGDGSGTNKNEGRAGWKATDYLTDKTYNGVVNPFYNPSTQTFDFSYYMSNQGYTGVDFVVLQLGINDLYNSDVTSIEPTWTAMETIIDSILAYNSGIKIILNLPTTPNSNQSVHSVPEFLYRNRVIRYNAYAQAQVKVKYLVSQVRCSYCHLILDPDNDIRDNVHPTVAGYQKMALEVVNQINNWQAGV